MSPNIKINAKIDILSTQCRRRMTDSERDDFFKYQEEFIKSGNAYRAKYRSIRKYYKGKNRGKIRDVFEIDGNKFNKLWSFISPYVITSINKSFYYNCSKDTLEDCLSDIKFSLFRFLRFFDPDKYPLSSYLKVIVNNVLTNISLRRGFLSREEQEKVKKNHKLKIYLDTYREIANPISIFSIVEDENDTKYLVDIINYGNDEINNTEFFASVPDNIENDVYDLIEGKRYSSFSGITRKKILDFAKAVKEECV